MKIGNTEVYGIIYKITNKVNGKVYIGQTTQENGFKGRYPHKGVGVERVLKYHEWYIKNGYSRNMFLYNSIKKYGCENFDVCEVFDIAFSQDELNIKEECWISIYKSTNQKYGYNIKFGGDNHCVSENAKSKFGVEIVCINTNKCYKSMTEATKVYHISDTKIKSTFDKVRTQDNCDEYLFRLKEELDGHKEYRRCAYCGKIFKKPILWKKGTSRKLNNSRQYCGTCWRNPSKRLKTGFTKLPK